MTNFYKTLFVASALFAAMFIVHYLYFSISPEYSAHVTDHCSLNSRSKTFMLAMIYMAVCEGDHCENAWMPGMRFARLLEPGTPDHYPSFVANAWKKRRSAIIIFLGLLIAWNAAAYWSTEYESRKNRNRA